MMYIDCGASKLMTVQDNLNVTGWNTFRSPDRLSKRKTPRSLRYHKISMYKPPYK